MGTHWHAKILVETLPYATKMQTIRPEPFAIKQFFIRLCLENGVKLMESNFFNPD